MTKKQDTLVDELADVTREMQESGLLVIPLVFDAEALRAFTDASLPTVQQAILTLNSDRDGNLNCLSARVIAEFKAQCEQLKNNSAAG